MNCQCEATYCEAIIPAGGSHAAGGCQLEALPRPIIAFGIKTHLCNGCYESALAANAEGPNEVHTQQNPCCDDAICVCSGVRFVNVYEVDQLYGGPEEGGWWYHAGELKATYAMPNEFAADALAEALTCKCKTGVACKHAFSNRGRAALSSVLSDGVFQAHVDDKPGSSFPAVTPHYE